MKNHIQLDAKVKVSNLDIQLLPLSNFHIVIVVEPDIESWIIPDSESDKFSQILDMYSDLIVDDAIGDDDIESMAPPALDVTQTFIIMATESSDLFYFEQIAEYSIFIVKYNDFEFDMLRMLSDGIVKKHPDWRRVAIVGGIYEDEIIRAANAVQAAGLDVTIVTRYCISERTLIRLDELVDKTIAERQKRSGEP